MGRLEEAVAASRRALDSDPLSAFAQWRLGYRYFLSRQFDRAAQQFRAALELDQNYVAAQLYLALTLSEQGRIEEAIKLMEASAPMGHVGAACVAALYARAGRTAEARRMLGELEQRSQRSYVPPSLIAGILRHLGEMGHALEWLEKAVEEHDGMVLHVRLLPGYDCLRGEPRYQALLRKMHLDP